MSTLFLLLVWGYAFRRCARRDAWVAVLDLPCVLCAGLLAMHFFEPAAETLERSVQNVPQYRDATDGLCLAGMFLIVLWCLRWLAKRVGPNVPVLPVQFQLRLRYVAAALSAYAQAAILLTACETSAPLRSVLGIGPETRTLAGFVSPDRQWLSFVRTVSHGALGRGDARREAADHSLSTFWQRYILEPNAETVPAGTGEPNPGAPEVTHPTSAASP